jgi:hypothetical protein
MNIHNNWNRTVRSPFPWIAIIYLLSAKGHLEIIDTEYSVRTAIAIIEDGSMLIEPVDPAVRATAPAITGTDKIYSQYGLGLTIIFLPIVFIGKGIAAITSLDQRIPMDFLLSLYNIPFALLGLWFFHSILKSLGASEARATAALLLLAITTAFWKYSVTDFSEVTQATFLLGAIRAVLSNNPRKWRQVSLWLALLVAIKLAYVVLLCIFVIHLWLEDSRRDYRNRIGSLIDYALFLVPMGLLLATSNYLRFGSPFETGYGSQVTSFSLEYFRRDWFDYLFSTQRGILPFNPILLAAIPGWLSFPRKHRRFAGLCLSLILVWFLLMCFWQSLQGGYCWGNRLLVPILPLFLLPIAFLQVKTRATRFGLWGIAGLSILIQVTAACTKIHECSVLRNKIWEETAVRTPNQLPSTLRLFAHKITNGGTAYRASVLGVESNVVIDLNDYNSFRGFNLWPVHAVKFLGFPSAIRPIGLLLLAGIVALLGHLAFRHFRSGFSSEKTEPARRT